MTNAFNRLQTLVNTYDFITTYRYFNNVVVHFHDFLGFDEEWDEITNPDFDYEVAAEAQALAEELGFEIEWGSEDI